MVRRAVYLLEVTEKGSDSYSGHVVIAKNEDEARGLCPHGDEGDIWKLREHSTCTKIGTSTQETRYVLGSFHAG
ncbi:hypothetical protein LCGC14_1836080 [marine sediment metagenome]|uniref:Uncharacterized protein n=1 Tax=marine sediment metagenome TaxID=412755 RepID=A0A0F9IU38_9ZZZZ